MWFDIESRHMPIEARSRCCPAEDWGTAGEAAEV